MPVLQRVVQVCLYLFSAIALVGGSLQFIVGQPHTEPRLDNVHRFMAGIYFGCGLICFWTAYTITTQGTLVYLLAIGVFIAGLGRILSISRVGMPKPRAVWLGYLIPELVVPVIAATAQFLSHRR